MPQKTRRKSSKPTRKSRRRLGVWLVGARGGLATTLIAGARAYARGLTSAAGLLTETPPFGPLDLVAVDQLVFGGHDIRSCSTKDCADEIRRDSGSISPEFIKALSRDFAGFDAEVRTGSAREAGKAIRAIADKEHQEDTRSLREITDSLRADLRSFKERKKLDTLIVVNLASTEPPLRSARAHSKLALFEKALDKDQKRLVRPSTLYAYAAAKEACPFLHFTPSDATLIPAICELFQNQGLPYMGRDGKTGETLVKSALAPMFKYRNLQVMSWQGYNMLGDRDGRILDSDENKASKVQTKDSLLESILGYAPHTKVEIDFVPSLGDRKTAWDFVHFAGFLDHQMSLQFTWQGVDAVLAAPLVIDMVRLSELALRHGETGPMLHLAAFFKRPHACDQDDLHAQWHMLEEYLKQKLSQS
ncbi:MAG: myo-inositol-1-phosphate synthase [Planctomycetota bacterium]|nr:MAG: myo-inositol-1-phosphate synthase [Planctomycetota bacterium]